MVAKDNHSKLNILNRIGRLKRKEVFLIGTFTDAAITHFHIFIQQLF